VNHPPLSRDANATGVRAHFGVNLRAPAVATVLVNFPAPQPRSPSP